MIIRVIPRPRPENRPAPARDDLQTVPTGDILSRLVVDHLDFLTRRSAGAVVERNVRLPPFISGDSSTSV